MFWSTGNVKYKCIFLVIFFLLFLSEKFKSDLFKILTPWLNPLINPLNHIWRIRHVKPKPPRLVNTQGRVLACTQTCVREQQDASHNGRKPVIDRDGEGGGGLPLWSPVLCLKSQRWFISIKPTITREGEINSLE